MIHDLAEHARGELRETDAPAALAVVPQPEVRRAVEAVLEADG